ncbi:MAG: pitrilysin family protein [Armatimonadota bacterium]
MVNITNLDNGIRVITEHVPHVESVALGIWIGAGAKNEQTSEFGISHFLEHMLFKGTERRTAKGIADEIASVGGQMNAATDREYTTYYIKLLKEYVPLGMDVLTDMLRHSAFDAEEMKREQDVVSEEIRRHVDMPEDHVHDVLAQVSWGSHQLGHSVLGTEETVRSATPDSLRSYLNREYTPDRIVVSVAGNLEHQQVVDFAESTMGSMTGDSSNEPLPPLDHLPEQKIVDKETEAAYFCLGSRGYAELDDRKYALALLDVVFGSGMSSRLFQEVREKRGLAYDIGSYRVSFKEGGMFAIYGGTGVDTLGKVLEVISTEVKQIRESVVPDEEFRRAQTVIRGALLFAHESMGSRMGRMAKSLLDYGRLITMEEVITAIMAVTADDVREVARDVLVEDKMSLAIIGPGKGVRKAMKT